MCGTANCIRSSLWPEDSYRMRVQLKCDESPQTTSSDIAVPHECGFTFITWSYLLTKDKNVHFLSTFFDSLGTFMYVKQGWDSAIIS